jgi:arginine/lysine/ornithine decarboxylase
LLTIGLGSTDEDAQMVFDAVAQLASDQSSFSEVNKIMLGTNDKLPDLVYELTLDECYNKDTEEVSIKDAVGLISLEIKSPCPPGCIVLDIGQIITEEHL